MQLREETKSQLHALGVGIVYFFGSRAQGTALPYSDHDIGIVFSDARKLYANELGVFQEVYMILSRDIPDQIHGPRLDISLLQKANAALQMTAIVHGIVLFESDPLFRANYEERVFEQYDDYRYLNKPFTEATFRAFTGSRVS